MRDLEWPPARGRLIGEIPAVRRQVRPDHGRQWFRTGDPVMAIGGWSGRDPILTVDQFAALVAVGQVRYVLLPDGLGRDDRVGPNLDARDGLIASRNGDLFRWVTEHGQPVDPALWRPERAEAETDGSATRPVGPGPRGGGFGPPGFAGRPGWRAGLGRAQQLYDCRPAAGEPAVAPDES